MITRQDQDVLTVALTNAQVSDEITARIVGASVTSPAEATAALAIISDNKRERAQIREYLTVMLTDAKIAGAIADRIELFVEILGYQAADLVANNAALNAAQAKLTPLTNVERERMVVALSSRPIANRIADEIDATTTAMQAVADAV